MKRLNLLLLHLLLANFIIAGNFLAGTKRATSTVYLVRSELAERLAVIGTLINHCDLEHSLFFSLSQDLFCFDNVLFYLICWVNQF